MHLLSCQRPFRATVSPPFAAPGLLLALTDLPAFFEARFDEAAFDAAAFGAETFGAETFGAAAFGAATFGAAAFDGDAGEYSELPFDASDACASARIGASRHPPMIMYNLEFIATSAVG